MNTTPESLDLFRMFHELEEMGGTHATLEASSHALDLGRIYAMNFHTAGFTNFTRDHLDYHQTMEAYFAAKQLLFMPRSGPPPRFAVFNADDEWVAGWNSRVKRKSSGTACSRAATHLSLARTRPGCGARSGVSFDGLRFTVVAGDRQFRVESRWWDTSTCTTFCWPVQLR